MAEETQAVAAAPAITDEQVNQLTFATITKEIFTQLTKDQKQSLKARLAPEEWSKLGEKFGGSNVVPDEEKTLSSPGPIGPISFPKINFVSPETLKNDIVGEEPTEQVGDITFED